MSENIDLRVAFDRLDGHERSLASLGSAQSGSTQVYVQESAPTEGDTAWVWYKPSTEATTYYAPGVATPNFTVDPAITGSALVGSTLTCDGGTVTGSPTPSKTYQWKRDGTDRSGETASTYVLVSGDVGHAITCTVTATNTSGSDSAASNTVTPAVPANSVAPAVTGSAVTGQTLTCSTGTWSGSPTYAYQWKRAGSAISGATSSTYVLQVADEGLAIKCTVTATNANGSGTPTDSNSVTPSASATAPGQVTGLSLTPGDTTIAATWSAPASNGGSAITDYKVEIRNPGGSGSYTIFADGTSTSLGATITGLTNGVSVDVRVSAINAIGTGTASTVQSATPTGSAVDPGTVAGLIMELRRASLSGSTGDAKTSWADTSGAGRNHGNDSGPFAFNPPTLDLTGINGGKCLAFDGTQALKFSEFVFNGSATGWPTPRTFVILCKIAALPVSGNCTIMDGLAVDCRVQITSAGVFRVESGAGTVGASVASPTGVKVITVVTNGASSKVRVNGVEIATGTLSTGNMTGGFLGADKYGAIGTVKIGGYLVYDGALSGTDLTDAESALRSEGGV